MVHHDDGVEVDITHVDLRGGGAEQWNHERQRSVAEIGGTSMAAT